MAIYVLGEAFEATNLRTHVTRSADGGQTWEHNGVIYPGRTDRLMSDGGKMAIAYHLKDELNEIWEQEDRETAEAPDHVFNRRWFANPAPGWPNPFGGTDPVQTNPREGSPGLIKPAGPTDPTVSILALREPDGRPIAVYSAYSLHFVGGVPKGDISVDYYGVYCKQLERLLGGDEQDPPMVALMANASSGDINHRNFLHPRPPQEPYERIRFVSYDLAAKVRVALAKAEYRDQVTLAARFRERVVARPIPTAEQIAWAKQTLTRPAPKPDQVNLPGALGSQQDLSFVAPKTGTYIIEYSAGLGWVQQRGGWFGADREKTISPVRPWDLLALDGPVHFLGGLGTFRSSSYFAAALDLSLPISCRKATMARKS